jgi:hypothetical protein
MADNEVNALAPEEDSETSSPEIVVDDPQLKKVTSSEGRPAWCKPFPPKFQIPKGKSPVFMRFRGEWTETPHLGERQCVCWGITVGEEYIADKRADERGTRAIPERAKLGIRFIAAGEDKTLLPVDAIKSVPEADVDIFWEQIGLKCRTLLINTFIQTHSLSEEQRRDFFENCIEVRAAV